MARLPIYTQKYQPDTRRAADEDFGAIEGRAKSGFGQALGQAGDIFAARQDAEELQDAKLAASDLAIQLETELQDLRDKSGEQAKGHAAAANVLIDERWDELASKYSGKAMKYLQDKKIQSRNVLVPGEAAFQAVKRGKYVEQREIDASERDKNIVFSNPNKLKDALERQKERIEGYVKSKDNPYGIPEDLATKWLDAGESDLYTSAAGGAVESAASVSQLDAIVNELKTPDWQDKIASNNYERILKRAEVRRNQLENKAKVGLASERSRILGKYKDYLASTGDGNISDRPPSLSDENIRRTFEPEDAEEFISDLKRAEGDAVAINKIMSGDPDEALALARPPKDIDSEDYIDKKASIDAKARAYAAREKYLVDAPADYALQRSETVKEKYDLIAKAPEDKRAEATQDFTDTLVEEQRRLGVSEDDIQVVTSGQMDQYKQYFTDAYTTEGENIVGVLSQIKAATGGHFQRAIRNMYDAKAAPKGTSIVADLMEVNVLAASNLAEALKNFDKNLEASGLKHDEYDTRGNLSDYAASLGLGYVPNASEDFNEAVYSANAMAVRNTLGNVSDPKGTAADIINGRYEYKGDIRIPKNAPIDAGGFNWQMGMHLRNRFEDMYSDQIDWTKVGSLYGDDIVPPEQRKKDLLFAITQKTVRTLTSPDDKGVMILSEQGAPLLTKDGSVFYIPWEDIGY